MVWPTSARASWYCFSSNCPPTHLQLRHLGHRLASIPGRFIVMRNLPKVYPISSPLAFFNFFQSDQYVRDFNARSFSSMITTSPRAITLSSNKNIYGSYLNCSNSHNLPKLHGKTANIRAEASFFYFTEVGRYFKGKVQDKLQIGELTPLHRPPQSCFSVSSSWSDGFPVCPFPQQGIDFFLC